MEGRLQRFEGTLDVAEVALAAGERRQRRINLGSRQQAVAADVEAGDRETDWRIGVLACLGGADGNCKHGTCDQARKS